jgi:hypothetical protein
MHTLHGKSILLLKIILQNIKFTLRNTHIIMIFILTLITLNAYHTIQHNIVSVLSLL